MEICEGNRFSHEQIVHDSRACPLCASEATLAEKEAEARRFESRAEDAEQQVVDLTEEVSMLKSAKSDLIRQLASLDPEAPR